ncbi:NAD(P)-binding protein [Tothia fuscella]|uniref:NAD(P)-binding protein n=1 Tax=Tothia fuscella TaxID=1048955 RepID=A0A9P4NNH7_9PEZI|nr:NAD(P)-binding protein [Tothia fuscella]
MTPIGLAILIGAGPATGAGIARILASQGNFAVALLARRPGPLQELTKKLRSQVQGGIFEAFPTDTSPKSLSAAFEDIKKHDSFKGLKLRLAVFSVKSGGKAPFLEGSFENFTETMTSYVGGAFAFSQEALKRFFADHGEASLAETGEKKGTLIFTGTMGALRCNAQFSAYGASRASVRQLAQALGREMSEKGIHVAHTIANGSIVDEDGEDQKNGRKMSAEAVGKTYLFLHGQEPCLWSGELDMRPALEKY